MIQDGETSLLAGTQHIDGFWRLTAAPPRNIRGGDLTQIMAKVLVAQFGYTYKGSDVLAVLDQAAKLPDIEESVADFDIESGHNRPRNDEEQDSANPPRNGGKGRVGKGGKVGDPVSAILDDQRVAIVDTPKDGNCLFMCLGSQWGMEPVAVRKAVCDYIRAHIDEIVDCDFSFKQVIEEDFRSNVDKYLRKMNTDGTWGGWPEICAWGRLKRVHVEVYVRERNRWSHLKLAQEVTAGQGSRTTRVLFEAKQGYGHYSLIQVPRLFFTSRVSFREWE